MRGGPAAHALVVSIEVGLREGRADVVDAGDEGVGGGPFGLAGVGREVDLVAAGGEDGGEVEDGGWRGVLVLEGGGGCEAK